MVLVPASGITPVSNSINETTSFVPKDSGLKILDLADFQVARFGIAVIYQEEAERTYGHRIAVHEIPGRDEPVIQILGRKPREWSLSGLVLSFEEIDYLEKACELGMPETLYMPDRNSYSKVRIETASVAYSAGQRGAFNVSLTFKEIEIEDDGVVHAYNPKSDALKEWNTLISELLDSNINLLQYSPIWYRDDIALVAAQWGSLYEIKYSNNLGDAARVSPIVLVRELVSMMRELAPHYPCHYLFRTILDWDPNTSIYNPVPNFRLADKVNSNRAAFVYIVSILIMATACLRILNDIEVFTTESDVNAFISNLNILQNRINVSLIADSSNVQLYQSLVDRAVTDTLYYLRDIKSELPKLTSYESDGFNPALYLSYRLYNTPLRANELVTLNPVDVGRSLPPEITGFKRIN